MRLKQKSVEWLKRYLPAEIVCTATALMGAGLAHSQHAQPIVAAYFGSLGEAVGFYMTIVIQHLYAAQHSLKQLNKKLVYRDYRKIIIDILMEFGIAGIIDGLLLRPFFMYIFPKLLGNFSLGILIGKLVGDIAFYFLVILSYEIRKKYLEKTTKT